MSDSVKGEGVGLKVTEVMTRDVEFVAPLALLREAADMMGDLEVGALPVGTAEAIEGVLTDRDILYRFVARGIDPAAVTVRDVMTSPVIGCDVDDTVAAVMDAMAAHHIRRMPVMDARRRVVGWVTLAGPVAQAADRRTARCSASCTT